jgi:(5-formylfuran-3-yl)methyl phosphate synthase
MRLMISVISAQEAREAMSGGAVLLDVKNPEEGSLGAHPPRVIREIKEAASENIEISVAIGDMPYLPGTAALAALGAASCGADYIKVGLHGPCSETEAIALVREVKKATGGDSISIIAAGYADYSRIGALDPRCLPRIAKEAGIQGCLIDTAIKDGNTLFDYIKAEGLSALAQQAHAQGLLFSAAGALRAEHLPLLRNAGVDIAGLRTAVCRNYQRRGPLDPALVRNLINEFAG